MSYEPTQSGNHTTPVYNNRYEHTTTTDPYGIPIIPPPPPDRSGKDWGKFLIITGIIVMIIVAGVIVSLVSYTVGKSGIIATPKATIVPTRTITQATVVSTPTPTTARTSTPTKLSAPYSELSILNAFMTAGFSSGTNYASIDKSWGCCKYFPEGGAYEWFDCGTCTDGPGGYTVDIATFASYNEAFVDASDLHSQGLGTTVVNSCLLSSDSRLDQYEIAQYDHV